MGHCQCHWKLDNKASSRRSLAGRDPVPPIAMRRPLVDNPSTVLSTVLGPGRAVLVGCKEQDGCYIVKETVNKWKGKKISISFLQGIGLRAWEVSSSRFPGDRTHLRALPGGASPTKWGVHFPQPQKAGGAAGFQRGKALPAQPAKRRNLCTIARPAKSHQTSADLL